MHLQNNVDQKNGRERTMTLFRSKWRSNLNVTLEGEKNSDGTLSQLAVAEVNRDAERRKRRKDPSIDQKGRMASRPTDLGLPSRATTQNAKKRP